MAEAELPSRRAFDGGDGFSGSLGQPLKDATLPLRGKAFGKSRPEAEGERIENSD